MAKRKSKSISDLLGKKNAKPSLDEVNKIAEKIHSPAKPKPKPKPKAEVAPPRKKAQKEPSRSLANRTKRISLNAPLDLYLEIQREATLQGKPMMQYILEVVREDIDSKK